MKYLNASASYFFQLVILGPRIKERNNINNFYYNGKNLKYKSSTNFSKIELTFKINTMKKMIINRKANKM